MMTKKIGFNFLWMFSYHGAEPEHANMRELDFIADKGFNFVRIPTDYRFYVKDFECDKPLEEYIAYIDEYITEVNRRGMHASLNIHRAPGYCINRPDIEKYNLWRDEEAQLGFIALWKFFANRYKSIPSELLSFDLVNEPSNSPPTHPCTRDDHEKVIRRTISEIHSVDPSREIVIDGFDGGGTALPELADCGAIHSGRGYAPFQITHYKAEWVKMNLGDFVPTYPGEVAPGQKWDIDSLREYYRPWREVESTGCRVHIGECGVYNKLPNETALSWFRDFAAVMDENRWGYALWNFKGSFGICEHGRPGTAYTDIGGLKIDKAMLDVMKHSLKA